MQDSYMEDILIYQKYLDVWDNISAVRSKKNRYNFKNISDKELQSKNWFLEDAYPILKHDLLKSMDREKKQYLIGFFLLSFLEYSSVIEHEFVNTITIEIAQNLYGDFLPEIMRRDAHKIYTDEAYHAYFAIDGANQIRHKLNIPAKKGSIQHTRIQRIRSLFNNAAPADKFFARLAVVVISETVIAKEIHDRMKGIVVAPTYNMFKDHLRDEAVHGLYFATLFKIIWLRLTENEKDILGYYLAQDLIAYSAPNIVEIQEGLTQLGFCQNIINIVSNSYCTSEANIATAKSIALITFKIFSKCGVFDYPSIKEYFHAAGFNIP